MVVNHPLASLRVISNDGCRQERLTDPSKTNAPDEFRNGILNKLLLRADEKQRNYRLEQFKKQLKNSKIDQYHISRIWKELGESWK